MSAPNVTGTGGQGVPAGNGGYPTSGMNGGQHNRYPCPNNGQPGHIDKFHYVARRYCGDCQAKQDD
ncbi:hypothetical protein P154DRAFT_578426 [Amniculicola lignicola CBS 123094]|uniref:Uncharacterized protein n=1 Tax=Amniculicola lignicola CBS 123094 TaxID=1392246 RepID=A0A6A5WJP7_9PLEO|nr:hypothetical protein P154DRAFT_578426 [Amniculicola lignicola CBS 123094]